MKNKKGDIFDMLSFVLVIFFIIVGFFIISFIIPYITGGLKTAGLNNSVEGISAISKLDDFGTNGIQKGVFWFFIGLCLATLISAFFSDTHPIWLGIYIFILIITVIVGAYLANAYETMINLSAFNGWTQAYMTIIMQHMVLFTIGVGALSLFIMFSKNFIFGGNTT